MQSPSFPQNYNLSGHPINSSNTSDSTRLSGLQSGGRAQNAASFLPTGLASHLGSQHIMNTVPDQLAPSRNAQYGDLLSALSGMNVRTVNTFDDHATILRQQQEIESRPIHVVNSQGSENLGVQQPVFIRIGTMNFGLPYFQPSAMPTNTGFQLNNMTMRPEGQVDLRGVRAPFPVQYQNANAAYATFGPNEYMVNPVVPAMPPNVVWTTNVPHQFHGPSAAPLPRSHGVESLDPTALAAAFSSGQPMNYAASAASAQRAERDYMQYLRLADHATQIVANAGESSVADSYNEILGIQRAYLEALIQPDRRPVVRQGQVASNVSLNLCVPMPDVESPSPSPGVENLSRSVDAIATTEETDPMVLLEELKNSKTRGLQLHDILGHVIGFWYMQHLHHCMLFLI